LQDILIPKNSELEMLQETLKEKYDFKNIIGRSHKMHELFQNITQVAPSQATVLIRGESGTGKELIAHAIHYNSPRSNLI
jgi:Nif-specific regulatory protein